MFAENIVGPQELLEKYKQYEYILNVDKKNLIKELFGGEQKATIQELREKILHYQKAYDEILNLSNDIVEFPLFRVMAAKMKDQLSQQAFKIKEKLLENVYDWCKKSVEKIYRTYEEMNKTIMKEPTNERELVDTREFIKDTPNKVDQLSRELNEVYKHYCMLDDFSYKYADADIETFWVQKQWPLEISAQLTDGGAMIQTKEVVFMSKLDQEKDFFIKSIEVFKQTLEKIKKFHSLDNANGFAADA
jgi:hypothetical protein